MEFGINGTLCKFCRSIFEGSVAGHDLKFWDPQDLGTWTGSTIKHRLPHHRSLRELQSSAQVECLLCVGILDKVPEATKVRLFATDEAAKRERRDGCSEMQLHLNLERSFSSLVLQLIYPPTALMSSPQGMLTFTAYSTFSPGHCFQLSSLSHQKEKLQIILRLLLRQFSSHKVSLRLLPRPLPCKGLRVGFWNATETITNASPFRPSRGFQRDCFILATRGGRLV